MSTERTARERAEGYLRPRTRDKVELIQARGIKGIGWALLVLAETIAEAATVLCGRPQAPSDPSVPPGPCWHDSGQHWFGVETNSTIRCELLAGHAGAHTASRPQGGESVWLDDDAAKDAGA